MGSGLKSSEQVAERAAALKRKNEEKKAEDGRAKALASLRARLARHQRACDCEDRSCVACRRQRVAERLLPRPTLAKGPKQVSENRVEEKGLRYLRDQYREGVRTGRTEMEIWAPNFAQELSSLLHVLNVRHSYIKPGARNHGGLAGSR